jgi:hypothetical protein
VCRALFRFNHENQSVEDIKVSKKNEVSKVGKCYKLTETFCRLSLCS